MSESTVKHILLIDDEPSVLFALKLLLGALGYDVKDFACGLDAIAALRENTPADLILCDLKMPKIDGMGVLEEIRKIPSNVPFVLMSAHATPEEVAKAKGLGATGFLAKPFSPDQLKELVATV